MGILGRLLGSEKAMSAAIEGVSSGLDKLFYTAEEKSEDERNAIREAAAIINKWLENSQGQNLARRVLAFAIGGTWLLQYFAMMMFHLAAVWAEKPDKLTSSAEVIGGYADGMTGAMMLILGFYFAAPHLAKFVGPALERFGSKNPSTGSN